MRSAFNKWFRTAARMGFLLWLCSMAGCGKNRRGDGEQPDQIYKVVRGDFNIVVSVSGALDAIKHYKIKSPPVAKKGLDIIEAVEDQTILKKGDLMVAFSEEKYRDEFEDQKIKVEEAEKNLMLHEQDYQMKIADIVGLIKKATDTHRVSVETLEKYTNEDAPLDKKTLQQNLEAARKSVALEEQSLTELKADLLSAAMGDESARLKFEGLVEASAAQVEKLEVQEEKAAYQLRIFKQYTFPQQSRKLERDWVKAEMDLQKQLVNATAQRVQLERKISTQKRLLLRLRQQKEDLQKNIRMLRVTAPVDGVVSYGDPNPRRRHMTQKDIQVGTTMRPGELIGTIPDLSRLVVDINVPEISRSKVEVGMRAEIRIKALPNVRLSGAVSKISDMASNLNFWDRSSPKIYPTVITLDQNEPSFRPGMTVEVDMISEVIADVIFVPVEALFMREGRMYCQIKKKVGQEERTVEIGRSSSSFVEILEGVGEGDRVLLSREDL